MHLCESCKIAIARNLLILQEALKLRLRLSGPELQGCPCGAFELEWSFVVSKVGFIRRAENGALDPWSLDLRMGHPRFLPQIASKPFKIRV